jgi:hypothetical protein
MAVPLVKQFIAGFPTPVFDPRLVHTGVVDKIT